MATAVVVMRATEWRRVLIPYLATEGADVVQRVDCRNKLGTLDTLVATNATRFGEEEGHSCLALQAVIVENNHGPPFACAITEAKNRLSALIDSIKGGSPVLIVDRGRPVARQQTGGMACSDFTRAPVTITSYIVIGENRRDL